MPLTERVEGITADFETKSYDASFVALDRIVPPTTFTNMSAPACTAQTMMHMRMSSEPPSEPSKRESYWTVGS